MIVEPLKISVRTTLEYAFAAYRVNKGYIRTTEAGKKLSNKDLVFNALKHLVGTSSSFFDWLPKDIKPLEVTDEDRASADLIDDHFKKYMFKSLAGKLNQFENDVYSVICSENISVTKAGLVAYVPELINRDRAKWEYEKMLRTEYKNSKPATAEKVGGNMIILDVKKITKVETQESFTIVIAGLDGNLYQFYKNDMSESSKGKQYNISGRVKKSDFEYNTKIPLTVLNYVKVLPCRNR